MAPRAAFLVGLPKGWRVISALVGAASVGLAVGVFLYGFTELPGQVTVNTTDIASTRAEVADIRRDVAAGKAQFERIICLLVLPDSITPIQAEGRCP